MVLLLPQQARLFEHRSRNEGLIKTYATPWFSFGKSVITVHLPEFCFVLLKIRILVKSRARWDGRDRGLSGRLVFLFQDPQIVCCERQSVS
jgi:hypothetical protein